MRTTLQDLQRAVQAGNYYLARQCFLELLVEPDAPLPQVFCEMSVAEFQHGNARTALAFSEAGDKLLTSHPTDDPELMARLRNNLVAFYREAGDVSRAITVGRNWLDEFADDPTPNFRRGQICYNMALAFRQRGGPHDGPEALRYYDLARVEYRKLCQCTSVPEEQHRFRLYEVMALQNEAWLTCEMGDLDRAVGYTSMAAKLLSGHQGPEQREQALLSAYLAYTRHDLPECATLLEDLQLCAEKATPRQQFWTEWLAARVSLLTNQKLLADVHSALAAAEADRTKEVYLMRLAAELDREIRAAG